MKEEGRGRVLLFGALAGAVSGTLLGIMYLRCNRRRQAEGASPIKTGQLVRVGVSLMPALRQLLELLS